MADIAKTPENLARLPPKLRARLLARGIIKETDLAKSDEPKKAPIELESGRSAIKEVPESQSITLPKPRLDDDRPADGQSHAVEENSCKPNADSSAPGPENAAEIILQTLVAVTKRAEERAELQQLPAPLINFQPEQASPENDSSATADVACSGGEWMFGRSFSDAAVTSQTSLKQDESINPFTGEFTGLGTPPDLAADLPPDMSSFFMGPISGIPDSTCIDGLLPINPVENGMAQATSIAPSPVHPGLLSADLFAAQLPNLAPPPGTMPMQEQQVTADMQSALGMSVLQPKAAAFSPVNHKTRSMSVLEPKAAAWAPAPVQTVFASAPILAKNQTKRAAEDVPQEEAKRQKIQESDDVSVFPADARAAAAKEVMLQSNEQTPVWIYKDGVVSEVGSATVNPATAVDTSTAESTPAAASESSAASEAMTQATMPPPAGPPPTGPPLPPGWVRVPHENDFYYWNTTSNEVSWEHPAGPKGGKEKESVKEVFTEEHKVLWTDLGKLIGRQGINLKIIKASIGCSINVPRRDKGKGKGKDKDKDKGKSKGKGKDTMAEAREKGIGRGIGTGENKLGDDQFVTVSIKADTAYAAKGGKRMLEVMLGYGRNVEAALGLLGVEVKMPSIDELTDGKASVAASKTKDGVDPMDPASYSDAPVGGWTSGLKKSKDKQGGGGGDPKDSKTANAERF